MRRRSGPSTTPDELADFDPADWPDNADDAGTDRYLAALRAAGVKDDDTDHLYAVAVIRKLRARA